MYRTGFTLAELLIALLILGVIATFTIPKVLQSNQSNHWNATARETMAAVSEAYSVYRFENTVSASFNGGSLSPYFNYVKRDSSKNIDSQQGQGLWSCNATNRICLDLHNGGTLFTFSDQTLNNLATTNAIQFWYDPDGIYIGTNEGPGKSLRFFLYYNGKVNTIGDIETEACDSSSCVTKNTSRVANWFSWN